MLVRIFEYATQVALDQGELEGDTLTVSIPHSAVLFLRCTGKTPDKMKIVMETPGGTVHFNVPVMKTQKYTIEEIFEKKLLFLIPFYIFSHEKRFSEYDTDMKKVEALKEEYMIIIKWLNQFLKAGEISVYTFRTIIEMSGKVLENIAQNFENVREGVKSVMGGRILEYEAKTILNKGKIEGRAEGKMEQARETAEKLRTTGMDENTIADMVNVSVALIREWFQIAPV